MTPEQVEIYRKAAETGAIPDEMNPLYLFSQTHTHLLVRIVGGELDPRVMAGMELNRRHHVMGADFPAEGVDKRKTAKNKMHKNQGRKM